MDLEKCVNFIKEKHAGQTRKHGTPYYMHPLSVSKLVAEKGFDIEYQVAGLFHDLLEDTDATFEEIINLSNENVLKAVKLLTKTKGYIMDEYIENIRNNEIAKIVKLADRIHNLSEAHLASKEFQEKYIKETEEWYIPLAEGTIFEEDLKIVLNQVKDNVKK